jgi:hypothetical protein
MIGFAGVLILLDRPVVLSAALALTAPRSRGCRCATPCVSPQHGMPS